MRVFVLVYDPDVLELDVEVLVDGVEDPSDGEIVLQFNRHFFPHQLLEVGEEELQQNRNQTNPHQKQVENSKQRSPCQGTKKDQIARGRARIQEYHLRNQRDLGRVVATSRGRKGDLGRINEIEPDLRLVGSGRPNCG